MEIIRWGSDDIKATHIGVKGSKTTVIRVFPPGKSTRKCRHFADAKSLAGTIVNSFKNGSGESAGSVFTYPKKTPIRNI